MLLAIDIGNTNITLGMWNGRAWSQQWRLRTAAEITLDELGLTLKSLLREFQLEGQVERVVLCSVVPWLTATFLAVCEHYLGVEALNLTYQLDAGIRMGHDNPAEVGADRIANMVAAYHLFPGPAIVVDMGTATKFEVMTADGLFMGGVIAPGLRLAADALASRAAQLRSVPLEAPPHLIGRNTIHAIQSGLILGYAAMIDTMVARLRQQHPDNGRVPITVIGTGGNISLVANHLSVLDAVDPWLTLTGLRLVSDRLTKETL
ncbi:MAG: type III pantothenate kinase [Chloroflexi bacterium]|nr:type III pantothenate kinase [Chloroflexota bacterium]